MKVGKKKGIYKDIAKHPGASKQQKTLLEVLRAWPEPMLLKLVKDKPRDRRL